MSKVLNKQALMQRITDSMGVVVGATVATAVNGIVEDSRREALAIPLGLGKIFAGIAIPLLMQGNKIVEGIGDGMIAVGTLDVMKKLSPDTFPGLSGIGDQMPLAGIGAEEYAPLSFTPDDDFVEGTEENTYLHGVDDVEDDTINGDFDTTQTNIV